MNNQVKILNSNSIFDPFSGPEIEKVIYTTKSQSEIWAGCYLGGKDATRAYNESVCLAFNGLLDVNALEKAIQTLVDRHEALRAAFSPDGIYMSIFRQLMIKIYDYDLSLLDKVSQNTAMKAYINKNANHIFDLVYGPLIKFDLLKFSDSTNHLIITAHHIICDGWSIGILLQDLGTIYSAYTENKVLDLPVAIPFSAYANELQLFSKTEENRESEKFWYEMYHNSVPIVNLPTDNPRPSQRTYKSDRLDFAIDETLLSNLKQLGINVGSSLVTTLLTSFEIFLYQLTGQDDLVVGLPSSGQAGTGMTHLVGHCANLLPLRSKLNINSSFIDYLKQRKTELFDAYDHHQLSFGHLLQKLNIARDPSRIPLVPVVFNIDIGMTDGVKFTNLSYKLTSNPRAFETFEIFVNASGDDKSLVFEWSFNNTLFKPETIKTMMQSFEELLYKIVAAPSQTLEQITFQDFTSHYNKLNATLAEYPKVSLPDLLAIQALKTPNNIAVEYYGQRISYQRLHEQANQMAHYLQSLGITSGDVVAVALPRGPELVISLLAIMQCGAAYLPLDHEYPVARLQYILEDAGSEFLITQKALTAALPKWPNTIMIEDAVGLLDSQPRTKLKTVIDPSNLAYLIYTSGSTGNPKGVAITHRNLVNLLTSIGIEPGIKETDRVLFITTIAFDIAGLELYLPLTKGATLVIANHETARDGRLLLEMIVNEKISILQATPITYQMLIAAGWLQKLPIKLFCCGEALPFKLATELLKRCEQLWNMYGPTETTIYSAKKQIKVDDTLISIGVPIDNTQFYIINKKGKLLPPESIGEIAISGDGVGNGYWKRPQLSTEKFIENPFSKTTNTKLYRTGDLGRLLNNNEIECLGRIDNQVKIRGHRIETGEIEHLLSVIEGINSAVVLAKNDTLIAFIVTATEIKNVDAQIRIWIRELAVKLPSFMVPSEFNILKELPKTLNDKIDRIALLEYKTRTNKQQAYNSPTTKEEMLVAAIWQDYLNVENIDIFSDFFEMGGHSILAVNVMIKIEQETGKRIPLSALFENSTVEKFAKLLDTDNAISSDYLVPTKPIGIKTPLFIIHGAGLNILNFVNIIQHFDSEQPVYCFQGIGPNGYDSWFESIEEMASTYIESILKINPNGPYAIAGFSFGGVVAFEIARQLKAQGKTVSIIALLDTYVDSSYHYKSHTHKKMVRYYDRTYRRLDYLMEMLTSWKSFKLRINAKKNYIEQQYLGINNQLTAEEAIANIEFTKANAMVDKIIDRYHLKPQNIAVDLFRAKDDDGYKLDPIHLGWKKIALKGVRIYDIPGAHINIVAPPNDKILARMLQRILDERHGNT